MRPIFPKVFIALSAFCGPFLLAFPNAALPENVSDFLDINCYECHNDVEKKGGLDLESLAFDPSDRSGLKRWSYIFDRVKHHEMPPRGELQPEKEERADFLSEFEETLHYLSRGHQEEKGRVRSRRLNRIEYQNTIHALLGIDTPIAELLPEDPEHEGFSNIAEAQQISYHLLQKYLEVIDLSLDQAFDSALNPSKPFKIKLNHREIGSDYSKPNNDRHPIIHKGYAISMACANNYHGRSQATTVPEDGWYRIRIKAKAFNPQDNRGVWTQIRSGVCAAKAPLMFWVGSFLAEEESKEFEFEAYILAGHRLEIRPGDRTLKYAPGRDVNNGSAPELGHTGTAIEAIEMERIHRSLTPSEMRTKLFGDLKYRKNDFVSKNPQSDLYERLSIFANRSFRRPVSKSELLPYLEFAKQVLEENGSLKEAIYAGYRAILSSPRFLFFTEKRGRLDDFAVASRLSYFLWSAPPDEELLALARKGVLTTPLILSEQVDRLLDDPRSEAFIANFTDSWLSLKDIDFTSPDRKLYPEFDDILKNSMVAETRAFLSELVRQNLSVSNIIDSDFAMLNERLATHYDISGVTSNQLQKVSLTENSRRGGIITHGSILKVTANGTTTSPILRGVWLLERILGEHVPPPPDDVPAVEPDIRGAVSIRDQLDKHRDNKSCQACHQKIDPPGFALENYDVIGGWRDHYRAIGQNDRRKQGQLVDASYELANGKSFQDISGFKKLTLAHPDKIAETMLHKLLVYGTGASIEFADRREIHQIVEDLESENYGVRSLIHAAAQSDIFLSK